MFVFKIKKLINSLLNFFGYSILKHDSPYGVRTFVNKYSKNFDPLYRLLINNNPIIFDIGANNGSSIDKFKKHFPKSKIYSFEPIPELCETIKSKYINFIYKKKNDKDNNLDGYLKMFNYAVGDTNEVKKFNIYRNNTQSSFNKINENSRWFKKMYSPQILKRFNKEDYHPSSINYTTIDVKQIKLDDFTNENKIDNIDFLKIDTQGYEDKVLLGASELLKKQKIKVIQLELILSEIYNNSLNFYDVEKLLIPNGYKLFAISKFGNLYHDINFSVDAIYINQETKKLYYNNHTI